MLSSINFGRRIFGLYSKEQNEYREDIDHKVFDGEEDEIFEEDEEELVEDEEEEELVEDEEEFDQDEAFLRGVAEDDEKLCILSIQSEIWSSLEDGMDLLSAYAKQEEFEIVTLRNYHRPNGI